jgi:hypothetical protein
MKVIASKENTPSDQKFEDGRWIEVAQDCAQ